MKKLLITAVLLVVAGTMVSAGGWEPVLPGGALQFGGYADVVYYNFSGDASSFALNHFVLDAQADLMDDVLVRAEMEWANQRLLPDQTIVVDDEEILLSGVRDADADLTYAYVDYALMDAVTLRAGKFLVPFNVYNERLYRADVAKLASPPFINSLLMPVKYADTGIQLRGAVDTGTEVGLDWALYYVNGLGQDIDIEPDKAMGGRLAVVTPGGVELGLSGYNMSIDAMDETLTLIGADMCYRFEGFELRGEYMKEDVVESADGFYLQAAYAFLDRYEVVARYDEVESIDRTTLGANYSLTEDLTFRLAYEWNDLADGVVGQLAVRF
jgi:opacity protein-like surface antigen